MTTFGEQFQESNGEPIHWDGETVQMMYELPELQEGSTLRVEFIHVNSERSQVVRIKCRGGMLRMNGEALDDIAVWSDQAPTVVDAAAEPKSSRKPLSVRIWNAWEGSNRVMHSWIGNAGIIVKPYDDGSVVLCCSDGYGDPNFKDLVVRVAVK